MNFFAVYLASKRIIALQPNWIENPVVGKPSKVFFSKNPNTVADFSTEPLHFLNGSIDACYEAFVYKCFGKYKVSHILDSR